MRRVEKSIFGWHVLLATVVVIAVFLEGCIRRDKDGVFPEEVARNFLIAVQKNDYSTAAKYWNSDAPENFKHNSGLSFNEYCEKYFKCDTFELGKPYTGKTGYVFIEFSGKLGGKDKGYALPLKKVDDRWLLYGHRLTP